MHSHPVSHENTFERYGILGRITPEVGHLPVVMEVGEAMGGEGISSYLCFHSTITTVVNLSSV